MQKISKLLCFVFTLVFCLNIASPVLATTLNQKETLQTKLDNINQQIQTLEKENEDNKFDRTSAQRQLNLIKDKIDTTNKIISSNSNQISDLKFQISSVQCSINMTKKEIEKSQKKIEKLNQEFKKSYDKFCERMRATYISGGTTSEYLTLLNADGVADLLTKSELISRVNRSDTKLMKKVKKQISNIQSEQEKIQNKNNELKEKRARLTRKSIDLSNSQKTLKGNKKSLEESQRLYSEKKQALDTKIIENDAKTKKYGELKEITAAELAEIDAEIEAADKKYREETTKQSTTKNNTTHKVNNSESHEEKTTEETTHSTTQNSNRLKLTYPCPSHRLITCGFGAYNGHTGCDFSTFGKTNCKIVAAESGTVIISRDLKNPDGTYRSYGRYIVIRHDKKTSSGSTVYTLYAHNNVRLVNEGQHVKKGQKIALSGSTGNSTGPHCHFEVRVGGSGQSYAVNPARYLS